MHGSRRERHDLEMGKGQQSLKQSMNAGVLGRLETPREEGGRGGDN